MIDKKEAKYFSDKRVLEDNTPEARKSLVDVGAVTEENLKRFDKEKKLAEKVVNEEQAKENIKLAYNDIISILKKYLDMKEDYYSLIATWIIGTHIHKEFGSYPYLFINAMRGSGKTRLLKLIASLAYNGQLLASMSEAVLFRTAWNSTFCIDEFEGVGKKERANLRELLNSAYKKGTKVKRMRKKDEEQIVEEFSVYCPIALANIWGMEEVLADRCISLILEKSDSKLITKLIEDFETNENIKNIVKTLNQCSLCSVVTCAEVYREWNNYISLKHTTTQTTQDTLTTILPLTTYNTLNNNNNEYNIIFDKIDEADIKGRDLELFFPLFLISSSIGEEKLDTLIEIAHTIIKEKRIEEMTESKDVALIDFVSQLKKEEFFQVNNLKQAFIEFLKEDEKVVSWINVRWLGRALKRLSLVKEKRRLGHGIEVIPNIEKAKKKIRMYKTEEELITPIKEELEVVEEKVT